MHVLTPDLLYCSHENSSVLEGLLYWFWFVCSKSCWLAVTPATCILWFPSCLVPSYSCVAREPSAFLTSSSIVWLIVVSVRTTGRLWTGSGLWLKATHRRRWPNCSSLSRAVHSFHQLDSKTSTLGSPSQLLPFMGGYQLRTLGEYSLYQLLWARWVHVATWLSMQLHGYTCDWMAVYVTIACDELVQYQLVSFMAFICLSKLLFLIKEVFVP